MPNAAKKPQEPSTVVAQSPSSLPGKLKSIGGSMSDDFNHILANQTVQALWVKHSPTDERQRQRNAAVAALVGIGPKDELEGMLAAHLIACHRAPLECFRRAMIGEQTFQGRQDSLNQANKLSRTYTTLLEALNRHRGKGQQKVTVEHVHVHDSGQAIVGNVEGGRDADEIGGSTPCTWICKGRDVAEQRRGAGSRASHRRWQTGDVECTVEHLQE